MHRLQAAKRGRDRSELCEPTTLFLAIVTPPEGVGRHQLETLSMIMRRFRGPGGGPTV
ncbi:hypothetical protein MESS4_260089 [Mesorhizobium sp. STM 4661]|nr:hypothetical protein MESS4_260089 [Mesorhizobium sp. STM 4661]